MITFYEIQNKNFVLWGEEKIVSDARELYKHIGLHIMDTFVDTNYIPDLFNRCIIICSFNINPYIDLLHSRGYTRFSDYITIDDLNKTLDERDLVNIAVNHKSKKVVLVYDNSRPRTDLSFIKRNPHIRIYAEMPIDRLCEMLPDYSIQDSYFVIVCNPNADIRDMLYSRGMRIGENFIFYTDTHMIDTFTDKPVPLPSELLRDVMLSKATSLNGCVPYMFISIWNTTWCCYAIDNIRYNDIAHTSVNELYNDIVTHILALSISNKTFIFCKRCPFLKDDGISVKKTTIKNIFEKKSVHFGYDLTCNLNCIMCNKSQKSNNKDMIHKTILEECHTFNALEIASGEVGFSKSCAYDVLFNADISNGTEITLQTNGQLWDSNLLDKAIAKVGTIKYFSVSVNAACKDTYEKIMVGANWERVMNVLGIVRQYRKLGHIAFFRLTFVVSSYNFREMKEFVKLGKLFEVDNITFFDIYNDGSFPKQDFVNMRVMGEKSIYHKEYLEIINDDIFEDDSVLIIPYK